MHDANCERNKNRNKIINPDLIKKNLECETPL